MSNIFRHITVALALAVLAGCGGQGGLDANWQSAVDDTAPDSVAFQVEEQGNFDSDSFRVELEPSAGKMLAKVSARQPISGTGLYLNLSYDANNYQPLAAQIREAIAPLSDSLVLKVLDVPGQVSLSQQALHTSPVTVPAGTVVAEVLFDQQPFNTAAARAASSVPVNTAALSPLVWDTDNGLLRWYLVHQGDYDQNGEVNGSDLAPLGRLYGETGPFAFESEESVVDGDSNGEIGITDLTSIGQKYGSSITGYNLYASADLNDIPASYDEPSKLAPLATVYLDQAENPGQGERLSFSHAPAVEQYGLMFWVRPFVDDGLGGFNEGTRSNINGPDLDSPPPVGGSGNTGYNIAPTAMLALTFNTSAIPLATTLDGSGSNDPDGSIMFYEWDFEGDELFDAYGLAAVIEHTYTQPGTYAPVLRVTDNEGAQDTIQLPEFTANLAEVTNINPTADLFATDIFGFAPLTVGLIGNGSRDVDGIIEYFSWDFDGDGTFDLNSGNDSSVLHTFENDGVYNVRLQVVDDRGGSDQAVLEITVHPQPVNQLPQAEITATPQTGFAPLLVQFDASASADPDGSITEYAWDLDGDGGYDTFTDGAQLSHTYTGPGTFSVGLRVTDDQGGTSKAVVEVSVNILGNLEPTADLAATPPNGTVPLTVGFDASTSFDSDGSIVRYDYDFNNDGVWDAYDSSPAVNWVYSDPGSFTARVRVTDDSGAQDISQLLIETNALSNSLPVASITALPPVGVAPLSVLLDASGSSDSDGSIVSYEWDFNGDGIYDGYGDQPQVTHTFNSIGIIDVWVRVTDTKGAQATNQVAVEVASATNSSPSAGLQVTPGTGDAPLTAVLDASASFDTDGSIVLFEWDFDGDGLWDGYSSQDMVSHVYHSVGSFSPRVRVTDDGGAQDNATGSVSVSAPGNLQPTAALQITPPSGAAPLNALVDASGSTDADGTLVLYEWDFNGDGLYDAYGSQSSFNYSFTSVGTFNVTVRVTDDGGSQDTSTASVTVTGAGPGGNPPTASVSATPLSFTTVPVTVTFDPSASTDSDGSIIRYDWDWDSDGLYDNTSFSSSTVQHTFTSFAVHTITLRVTDDENLFDTDTVTINPDIPPIADISLSPNPAGLNETITVDASGSTDPGGSITKYEFDLDANGSYETDNGTNPIASTSFASAGDFIVRVRITDNNSNTDTDQATAQIRFADITRIPGTSSISDQLGFALIGGNPAISFYDGINDDLKYCRATNATGSAWGPVVTIATNNNVGRGSSLVEANGRPAVVFRDQTVDKFYYLRANDATGSSWTYASKIELFSGSTSATDMKIIGGNPAVVFAANSPSALKYVRASNADGSAWNAVQTVNSGGTNGGADPSLAEVNGMPAVTFFYWTSTAGIKYRRATNLNGTAWSSAVTVASNASVNDSYDSPTLQVIDGNPAVLYHGRVGDIAAYKRATDANGTAFGSQVTIKSGGDYASDNALVFIGGLPLAAFVDSGNDDLLVSYGSNAGGTAWDASQLLDGGSSPAGWSVRMKVMAGKACLVYEDAGGSGDLSFARIF